jgi:hypothetical protein
LVRSAKGSVELSERVGRQYRKDRGIDSQRPKPVADASKHAVIERIVRFRGLAPFARLIT